ncbi:hypothetical protein ACEK07_46065 [Alcanivoracaceae bacterium MT1]
MMQEPDWNRMREAVERVIAKHEQRIRNEKLRNLREKLRTVQKGACIASALIYANKIPFPASVAIQCAVVSRIEATPARIFKTDRPQVDPLRARAFERLRHWGMPKPKKIVVSQRIGRAIACVADCADALKALERSSSHAAASINIRWPGQDEGGDHG